MLCITEIAGCVEKLYASVSHNIMLFSMQVIQKLKSIQDTISLKMILLPLMNWVDHSILKHLVEMCGSKEASLQLQEFYRQLQVHYSQPIFSCQIADISQLIVPFDDHDYTVISTTCNFNINTSPLQNVVDMKGTLTRTWKITDHALQLIAKNGERNLLYWMIPKCVLELIKDKQELNDVGIKTAVFPCNLIDYLRSEKYDMESDPFFYLKVVIIN